jgi:sterol desaturase/sphingolipid hydroxylase (fatty acid hydroxylase superfamily)
LGLNLIIVGATFSLLTIIGLIQERMRSATFSRSAQEWVYDGLGLFIQGVVIPLIPLLIVPYLKKIFPQFTGILDWPFWVQFILSFVVVDYMYYWNHRVFHQKKFWNVHRLHHSSRMLDIFATSRNSLVTSFLTVYLWGQILGLFLFSDPSPFLLGLAMTYALDLYRHSGFKSHPMITQTFGQILILPEHHLLHHSLSGRNKNFGANLSCWDHFHGTYSDQSVSNEALEKLPSGNSLHHIFIPWRKVS